MLEEFVRMIDPGVVCLNVGDGVEAAGGLMVLFSALNVINRSISSFDMKSSSKFSSVSLLARFSL